jgi:hypothetical protein
LPKKPQGWQRPFDDPVALLRGRALVTLKDGADYIMKPPKPEQNLTEWQAATEALIMAAEGRGPVMHARVGMLRALNRNVERVFDKALRWKWRCFCPYALPTRDRLRRSCRTNVETEQCRVRLDLVAETTRESSCRYLGS